MRSSTKRSDYWKVRQHKKTASRHGKRFFYDGVYFLAVFLVAAFLGAAFAAVFFGAAAFLGAAFLASGLAPAAFAWRASWLCRRATLFLCIRFFLEALSNSLCAFDCAAPTFFLSPVRALWKALTAVFNERFALA